jgi:hypothetical protein
LYIMTANAIGYRIWQLAVNLRIPYDSLKESGLTKDQARELSRSRD